MSCPPLNEFFRLEGGTLEAEERKALLKHLSDCPACRRSWSDHSLAAALTAEPLESAPTFLKDRAKSLARASDSPLRPASRLATPTRRWRNSLALAAALLVATGLGWWASAPDSHPTIQRGDELNAVKPILTEPTPLGDGGTLELGWSRVEGARDYLLTIADTQGDIVHEARIPHPADKAQASIIVGRTDGLVAGRTYVWDVVARLSDGTEIESGIRSFVFGNDD